MIDRLEIIKKIRNLRLSSDNIVFIIPSSYSLEDATSCFRIIDKFKFRSISAEITYDNINFLGYLKKFNINNFILRLEKNIFSLLKNQPSYSKFRLGKNFKLHLQIKDWQDLDILIGLEEISSQLNCKDVIISIKDKKDIALPLPYVLNSIPIIYRYRNNKKLFITLKNISPVYFQTVVPVEIEKLYIEPNNRCNLSCPFCSTGQKRFKPKPDMNFDRFKKIIDQFPTIPPYVYLFGRGEPFLNKDIFKMIQYLKDKGCFRVIISTNGHFLNKENIFSLFKSKLDKLIIGLDSIRESTYKQLRVGGNFDLVLHNIKMLSKIKRKLSIKPEVYLQFIITRHNEDEVALMRKFTEKLGFRAEFKTVATGKRELMPLNRNFRRSGKGNTSDSKPINFCLAPWNSIYISCNGLTILCCKLGFSAGMGNLNKEKLADIWNGNNYQNIRKQMLVDKHKIRFCTGKCPCDPFLTAKIIGNQFKEEEDYFYTL